MRERKHRPAQKAKKKKKPENETAPIKRENKRIRCCDKGIGSEKQVCAWYRSIDHSKHAGLKRRNENKNKKNKNRNELQWKERTTRRSV